MTERLGEAGMANEMKQFFSRTLLDRALPFLIHNRFGRMDGIPRNGGKSIEWRTFERPGATTSALTEGTPPSATNLTVSNVQATVQQYGAFTRHSEVLELQSFDPWIQQNTIMYGEHMGISLDTLTRNVIDSGSTVQYASTAGSRGGVASGMRITYAEIREMVRTLKNNDARRFPDLGNKYAGILDPDVEFDFMADSDVLTSLQNAGERGVNNPIFQGEIGDFYGIRFFVTSQVRTRTSLGLSGADVYQTLVMGQGYYGVVDYAAIGQRVIVKPVGSGGTSDPLDQLGTIGWKAAHAASRLNENFAVRLESTSSLGNEGS